MPPTCFHCGELQYAPLTFERPLWFNKLKRPDKNQCKFKPGRNGLRYLLRNGMYWNHLSGRKRKLCASFLQGGSWHTLNQVIKCRGNTPCPSDAALQPGCWPMSKLAMAGFLKTCFQLQFEQYLRPWIFPNKSRPGSPDLTFSSLHSWVQSLCSHRPPLWARVHPPYSVCFRDTSLSMA